MSRWLAAIGALALSAVTGCGSSGSEAPGGETHWLTQCAESADCARGDCLCGVCTERCSGDAECAGSRRAACYDVASPGLSERCASSDTAASPGVCLALCEADDDCPTGETCLVGACVAPMPVTAPTSTETPRASDYFGVDASMDFSQPVELPTPDLNIDNATSDLLGEWMEPRAMHLVISRSADGVVGEVYWESYYNGSSIAGPFQAARNPSVGYPVELDPAEYGLVRSPTRRVRYRMFDGVFAAGRLSFWTSPLDLWSDWCAMQKSYPYDVAGRRVYHCVPKSADASNTDMGKLVLCTSSQDGSSRCNSLDDPLCSLAYCECSATSCRADLRAGTVSANLQLEGTTLHGPVRIGDLILDAEFTKVAQ